MFQVNLVMSVLVNTAALKGIGAIKLMREILFMENGLVLPVSMQKMAQTQRQEKKLARYAKRVNIARVQIELHNCVSQDITVLNKPSDQLNIHAPLDLTNLFINKFLRALVLLVLLEATVLKGLLIPFFVSLGISALSKG